jgi:pyridoxal/pyridoxine/pyridoxamine kinase
MKEVPKAATRVAATKLGSTPNSVEAAALRERRVQTSDDPVEVVVALAAIERALSIYQQLQTKDPSVIVQPRKILQRIFTVWSIRESKTSIG